MRPPDKRDFVSETIILLKPGKGVSVQVDMTLRVQSIERGYLPLPTFISKRIFPV